MLSAPLLRQVLADAAVDELDLSGISFVDASGLRVLVEARDAPDGRRLRLLAPASAVMRILALGGELDTFAVWP